MVNDFICIEIEEVRSFLQGCVKITRGAQILLGVRNCIKIGHATHIRSIGLIQSYQAFFLCRKGDFPLSANFRITFLNQNRSFFWTDIFPLPNLLTITQPFTRLPNFLTITFIFTQLLYIASLISITKQKPYCQGLI